jgi:hypothetical protein
LPWLRSRTERSSGITTWAIEWREGGRDGRVRSRSLGAVSEKEAQYELAAMQAGKTARRAAPQPADPEKAIDGYPRSKPLSPAWGEGPCAAFRHHRVMGRPLDGP